MVKALEALVEEEEEEEKEEEANVLGRQPDTRTPKEGVPVIVFAFGLSLIPPTTPTWWFRAPLYEKLIDQLRLISSEPTFFLPLKQNWAFVARFCFLSDDGTFQYRIEYDKEYATQNLLLYYDSNRQWPAVYKTNKTCEQKEGVLSVSQNQIVNLTELRADSGCVLSTVPPLSPSCNESSTAAGCGASGAARGPPGRRGRKQAPAVVRRHILTCHNVRKFRSARERWWFLAVSNCNATKGLNLHYRFLMTNGPPGDYWHEHFSADEFYIMPTLMFFAICYLLMIIAIVMCTIELRSRQLLHATYKIFVFSVSLQSFGILFQSIAYIRYALDGVGFPRQRQLVLVI
ncbi:transmembrane protein 145-like [Frankliniella occidentalis]|uniref:Transmembrane protein 145-like n=1 Tax=Frankliniella occidentalis TaxID=133901 RepID=A0A9C6WYE9_FRAOC|nr:transmembrane protein 145-like [Frankliniella occidentalis]